jgi:hypothetical protein
MRSVAMKYGTRPSRKQITPREARALLSARGIAALKNLIGQFEAKARDADREEIAEAWRIAAELSREHLAGLLGTTDAEIKPEEAR